MTVKELIELLRQCPQDAVVYSEGCDCSEPAIGVSPGPFNKTIEISRRGYYNETLVPPSFKTEIPEPIEEMPKWVKEYEHPELLP